MSFYLRNEFICNRGITFFAINLDAPPARATVEVSRLPKDVLVEIDCVARVA